MKAVNAVFIKHIFLFLSMSFCSSSVCMYMDIDGDDVFVAILMENSKIIISTCDNSEFEQYSAPIKTLPCKEEQALSMRHDFKHKVWGQYKESLEDVKKIYKINDSLWNDLNYAASILQSVSRGRRQVGITRYNHNIPPKLFSQLLHFFPSRYTLNRFSIVHGLSGYSVTVPAINYNYTCNERSFEIKFDDVKDDILGEIHLPTKPSDAIMRHIAAIVFNDLGHIDNVLLIAEKMFNKNSRDGLRHSHVWARLMRVKSLVSMVDAATQDYDTAIYLQKAVYDSKTGFTQNDDSLMMNIVASFLDTR